MGFNELFWGLLFFFDFRLQGFDLLPDIIGYILIYNGLLKLETSGSHFVAAKKYALPLIFLSLVKLYQFPPDRSISYLFYILEIALVVCNLLLVYHICYGIEGMAKQQAQTELAGNSISRWKWYLVVQLITLAFTILPLINGPGISAAGFLVIPLFIFSVVVLIFLMVLMKQCEQKLIIS